MSMIEFFHNSRFSKLAACIFLFIFIVPQIVHADILTLVDGSKREGFLANRNQIAVKPTSLEYSSLSSNNIQPQDTTNSNFNQKTFDRKKTGINLILLGTAIGALGVLYKFGGDDTVDILGSSMTTDKSYSKLNYAMMAGGGVLLIVGVILSVDTSSSTEKSKSTFLRMSDETTQFGVCVRF